MAAATQQTEAAETAAELQTQEPAEAAAVQELVTKPEPESPPSQAAPATQLQAAPSGYELGSLVVPAVDPNVPTVHHAAAFICCTCGQECTESVTCARHSKGSEVRRCRRCHASKSAIQRLARAHDGLVQDFARISDRDLVARIEETVQCWQTESTKNSFRGTGEFLDEHELWTRYKDKPDGAQQYESVKRNSKQLYDRVREVTLYEDMKYTTAHEDTVERGRKRQRNLSAQQDMAEEAEDEEGQGHAEKKKPLFRKKGKGGEGQLPKLKKGDRSKITKRMEAVASQRMQCLDLLSRADKFDGMVPAYVCDCAKDCITEALAAQEEVDQILLDGHGSANDVLEQADKIFNNISSATSRLKLQVEQAASFKTL
ncbi:unnamed protein product [Symbiodinium sp. CCMP2456]|nr:unnamed protein product [Symbiodinium sp. CCMP2456]